MTSDQVISSSSQPAPRLLPELPNEIFLLIIQRCPGATLKQLRLVSKSLAQMTEPFLWRKVVLVPNDHCILGFIKTLKRSKVLRHVNKLTYDGRFGNFFKLIKDVPPDPSLTVPPADRTKELASLERTFQGHFKPYEEMSIEVACLAKALRLITQPEGSLRTGIRTGRPCHTFISQRQSPLLLLQNLQETQNRPTECLMEHPFRPHREIIHKRVPYRSFLRRLPSPKAQGQEHRWACHFWSRSHENPCSLPAGEHFQ